MRTEFLALSVCGLALLVAGSAVGHGTEGEARVIREIDIKGFQVKWPTLGGPGKPVQITSAEELARAFPNKDWQNRITRQVDFTREQILFFAWSGSGQDELVYQVRKGEKGEIVVFKLIPGETKDLHDHSRLYVLAKSVTWKVEGRK